AHVQERPELAFGDAERNDARAMVVDDAVDVGTRLVDAAMDEALEIGRPPARIDRIALERELHDVVDLDALGRPRPRQQKALRVVGMARADMPERIHDALARQDPVGGYNLP